MSGEGARIAGGRWNPKGSFAVLYLGLDEATVVAEFHRLAVKQRLAPADFLPRILFRYEGELHDLLDLRDEGALKAVGLTHSDLLADDAAACQEVGEAAFVAGREGILAPSATGAGGVLAVFLGRLGGESSLRDVASELWEEVPPIPSA
jgi:RES domain-containing protein